MQLTNAKGIWKSCQGLLFAVSAFLVFDVQADTWWVDDDNYDAVCGDNPAAYIAAGKDGTMAEKAFGTIRAALDNSDFVSGDTVKVKEGIYDKGGKRYVSDDVTSRVCINGKNVHLVGVDGKEKTFIVGASDSSGDLGLGSDAVRCIVFGGVAAADAEATVEGFTICGGPGDGGGLHHNELHCLPCRRRGVRDASPLPCVRL